MACRRPILFPARFGEVSGNVRRAISFVLVTFALLPAAAQQTRATRPSVQRPAGPGLPDAPSARRSTAIDTSAPRKPSTSKQNLTADSPYQPLTNRQKFNLFLRHTGSPYTAASAALNATWLQINGEPYSYGGGMAGWGRRFGANLAGTEARSFFSQFFFPVLLDQDPRYFPKRKGNIFTRGWYASTRVFVGRKDSGEAGFNSSYLLGVAATQVLSNGYAPADRRTVRINVLNILGAYGSDAGSLVLREFAPDLFRLFRRHAPERVKEIQEKIPPEILGMPPSEAQPKPSGSQGRANDCKPNDQCKNKKD